MKKILNRIPLLKYVVTAFAEGFCIIGAALAVLFAIGYASGIYGRIENALDLKYDSVFVTLPIILSAVLALICFFVGFLMYFHKYKRQKTKSLFGEQLRQVLEHSETGGQREGGRGE